jgi:hypothetical protein
MPIQLQEKGEDNVTYKLQSVHFKTDHKLDTTTHNLIKQTFINTNTYFVFQAPDAAFYVNQRAVLLLDNHFLSLYDVSVRHHGVVRYTLVHGCDWPSSRCCTGPPSSPTVAHTSH